MIVVVMGLGTALLLAALALGGALAAVAALAALLALAWFTDAAWSDPWVLAWPGAILAGLLLRASPLWPRLRATLEWAGAGAALVAALLLAAALLSAAWAP